MPVKDRHYSTQILVDSPYYNSVNPLKSPYHRYSPGVHF